MLHAREVVISCFEIAGVPLLMFCLLHYNRREVQAILEALREDDAEQASLPNRPNTHHLSDSTTVLAGRRSTAKFATLADMAQRIAKKERRTSFVNSAEEKAWLMTKLDVYVPSAWWIHPALLLLRLAQSSLLVMLQTQHMLASVSCTIAIAGVALVREASPYRRESE